MSGVVQGVGFRPFVARLATRYGVCGWVRNDPSGVSIHVEGDARTLDAFVAALTDDAPYAAVVESVTAHAVPHEGFGTFTIRRSETGGERTMPIGVDLPVCADCLREMRDPANRRFGYPYINCTNCGPRYTVMTGLPYDRPNTTMAAWTMCAACRGEYEDPADRRYHAQPIACGACGPHLTLERDGAVLTGDGAVVAEAAALLRSGAIVALKGLGGYHLACDARNDAAVTALRERKFRKEKPFALMVRDLDAARAVAALAVEDVALLRSIARPIVLAAARDPWPLVAPDQSRIGLMLPYAPLHELLFAAGAPPALVMTSGNRSSEPIAYRDDDARMRLADIADAVLVGERPIARRADDSVAQSGPLGPAILRRSRGYAPAVVARLPATRPILALGADLKNTVTLVVDGRAIVSPHIGDLDHVDCFDSFAEAIDDLLAMYRLRAADVLVAHDLHPQYRSTQHAAGIAAERVAVQHHHAHIASVLAEHGIFEEPVLGLALDGTGYGLDGTIWGCEFVAGSLRSSFERVGHLAPYALPGGDSAARFPALCAVGITDGLALPPLDEPPFSFPSEALLGRALLARKIATHTSTSAGRLFDAVAALCGFTGRVTFEGQAAMWLENLAERCPSDREYAPEIDNGLVETRGLLEAIAADRVAGADVAAIARAFHLGFARALGELTNGIARERGVRTVALSGGVWQNRLLFARVARRLRELDLNVISNRNVPVNDGGISLGQAALAASLARGRG